MPLQKKNMAFIFPSINDISFLELYHNHHRVPLDEIYEKVMARAKGCRSPVPA
jgi:hypothetical protein